MPKKIMTMGEILVEIMAKEVGQSFRRPGELLGPYPSGAPAIFIDQVGKLGCPAGMIGCVGNDDFGFLNTERLSHDGVDTKGIAFLDNETTGSAFVTYKSDGSRDFVFNIKNSASARLSADQVTADSLLGCTHFHVMGSSLFSESIVEAMRKAVDIVKNNGGTISFDPNIRKEILKSMQMREALSYFLSVADIFLPSGDELTLLVNESSEEQAISKIFAFGVKEIVIKRGAEGSTCITRSLRHSASPLKVTEIDPTGAGDCFGGTYVACRTLGFDEMESLRFANAAGAMAVAKKGPMEGASTLEQLRIAIDTLN